MPSNRVAGHLAPAGLLRFLRFLLVGSAGFIVDTGLLAALHHGAGLDPFTSRLVSITVAGLTTWRLNRRVTFEATAHQTREGLRYAAVTAATATLNYGIYAAALILVPGMPPLLAVVIAASVALGFTYAGYSRFVFEAPTSMLVSPKSQSR